MHPNVCWFGIGRNIEFGPAEGRTDRNVYATKAHPAREMNAGVNVASSLRELGAKEIFYVVDLVTQHI